MDQTQDFDQWWESRFGFSRLGNKFYPFLKQIHALGGSPDYVLKLALLFSRVKEPVREIRQSPRKREKGGIYPETYLHICEPALKEFGWLVFIETLRNLERIHKEWTTPPRTVPSQEMLNVLKIGAQIMKKSLARIFRESNKRLRESRKKKEQEIADSFKARQFGDIIYEYAFADLKAGRGKPSALWDTFFLTVLSEHLREKTPGNKPHYAMGAWFLDTKPSHRPHRETKRLGERVRMFKKAYPNWKQQVERIRQELHE